MNNLDIKEFRKKFKLTQEDLSKITCSSVRAVQSWEQGQRNITQSAVRLIEHYIENRRTNPEYIINSSGNIFTETDTGYVIKCEMIPFEAYASYIEAYNDEGALEGFDKVSFNVDKVGHGNYKGFKIKGDSMNGGGINDTPDGAQVLARELGRQHWKDGFRTSQYGWIILSTTNIFHKDIIALNKETGTISCHSRNTSPEYADFELNLNEVYQIFKVIKRTF